MAVTRDHRPWEGEGQYGWWEQVESLWDGTPQFEWRPPRRRLPLFSKYADILKHNYLPQLQRELNMQVTLLQMGGGREHPEHPE